MSSDKKIKGLYAIVDNTFSNKRSHVELAGSFLIGGAPILQLRIKKPGSSTWNREVYDVAKNIMKFKEKYNFTFIINDYVDVAAEVGADGVHVGFNDMPVEEIRKRTNSRLIVGYSAHSIGEAIVAERRGMDYVAFGAIYPTKTKGPGHPIQGIDKLKELVKTIATPVVAIGGINRLNVGDVIRAGASAAAMITGLTQAKDVVGETKWYVNKLGIKNEQPV